MGIIEYIREALEGTEEGEKSRKSAGGHGEAGSDVGISFNLGPDEESVDTGKLADVIVEHYGVSMEDAESLAEAIQEGLVEGYGYGKTSRLAEDEDVDLERDRIKTIVWTETAGFQTRQSVQRFTEQQTSTEVDWLIPDDGDVSPVCEATAEEIEERGGSVSLEELQSILRKHAEEHEDGTPERMDDWIPHERCRSTITPSVSL